MRVDYPIESHIRQAWAALKLPLKTFVGTELQPIDLRRSTNQMATVEPIVP